MISTKFSRRLLFADGTDGAGGTAGDDPNKPNGDAAAPPMSTIAVTGAKSEREIHLETELEATKRLAVEEKQARIDREKTICEMQDKHESYRRTVEAPKPTRKFTFPPTVLD